MRTLLTFILTLAIGGLTMADETPLDRRELRRQIQHLHEELLRMQKQIQKLTHEENIKRPAPDFNTLEQSDATDFIQPVNQALADLALSINRLQKHDKRDKPAKTHHRTLITSGTTYGIQGAESIHNRSVTIANTGTDIVVNPRLIVNNQGNWYSTPDMLNETLTPNMTDRDKALAIWKFLVDNRYHDQPAHSDIEVHDPVRFLNVYGYGFCDDSATNFMVLAEKAGIKARVWGLSGHVVPEAHFDGDWHMLDPDGEIYYLDDDGETISSIKTLEQRPDIIRKYPSPYYTDAEKLVEIYTTTQDNYISEWYREKSEATHTLAFTLRPGESLTRNHAHWGRYFSSRYLAEPKRYGNGTFTFQPIFENDTFKKGAESVRNLKTERADTTWMLTSTTRAGTLTYRFASPYPYLNGSVKIAGKGRIQLAFSETGDDWTELWASDDESNTNTTVPIGGYFRNGYGRPTYAYYLKLTLNGQIQNLIYQNDIQVAPQSLPLLQTGKNSVHYLDDTQGLRKVRIAFGYDIQHPQ